MRNSKRDQRYDLVASTLCLLALVLLLPAGEASEPDADPLNLVFFGNSLTSVNNVPAIVTAVAVAAGQTLPQVFVQTFGGATLSTHLNSSSTDILINQSLPPGETWDFAVLQEQSYMPSQVGAPAAFRDDAVALFDRVRAHSPDAVCTLFENWARDEGGWPYPPYFKIADMLYDIRVNTALARDDIDAHVGATAAHVAPIGSAWEHNGWNNLHSPDRVHATPRGSLLAGLVIYRRIYLDDTSDIPAANAAALLAGLGLTASDWSELTATADAVNELPAPLVHVYATGDFQPGGEVTIRATGPVGTTPMMFWYSSSLLANPWPSLYGDWFLMPPLSGPFDMGTTGGQNKATFKANAPPSPPGPYTVYLQSLSGTVVTDNFFQLGVN